MFFSFFIVQCLQFSAVEFSSSLQLFVFSFEFPSIFNYVFSILLRLSSAQQPALEQNEEIRSENWELHCSFAFQY